MPERAPPPDQLQISKHAEALAIELETVRAQLSSARHKVDELREALDTAHDRERLLAHELQHRVQNMLAVIRSIYRRSLENGASQSEFAQHFEGRLNAVARYQSAIAGYDAKGVELEDIVRNELFDARCTDGPHLKIIGPAIRLRQRTAELMGLAVHELTTNAIKFGALYHQGDLIIEWSVAEAPTGCVLRFRWREEGIAPLANAPRPKGFGQQLIEEALPYQLGATTSFELKPGGVDCLIILTIPQSDHFPQDIGEPVGDDMPFPQMIVSETDERLD